MVGMTTDLENKKRSRAETAQQVRDTILTCWRIRTDREIAEMAGVSPTTVGKHRKQLEESGEILPRLETGQTMEACFKEVSTFAVKPSPENDLLYEPIREDDSSFLSLVENIHANGILEPIVVSADGYIISGHRRHAAAQRLRMATIPVRIEPDVSHSKDHSTFCRRLASHNTQRVKTTAEAVREGVVSMDGVPWQRVCEYRRDASAIDGVEVVKLHGAKRRSRIEQKPSLERAIRETVFQNERDWPLSDRRIFYLLLNIDGLLRNDQRNTPFENSAACYNDVTNMVTRMRLNGSIPFDCIADETRPVIQWNTHRSVGTFVNEELDNLFSGYWRDLLQSQPNQIEVLVEKNTVATLLRDTAAKYTIPMTSGRGYSSLPPRKAMVDRFRKSGREKLVVIVVSDFDPEGEDIPNSFGLSLRDDFGVTSDRLVLVKAALTHAQTQTMTLHEGQLAKKDSARYGQFVTRYGERCWELEAIPADSLREIVEGAIRDVMDLEAFEHERKTEGREQAELGQHRQEVKAVLGGTHWSHDEDD